MGVSLTDIPLQGASTSSKPVVEEGRASSTSNRRTLSGEESIVWNCQTETQENKGWG
jgi:hypothetical protein